MSDKESDLKRLVDVINFDASLFNSFWDSELDVSKINSYDEVR